MTPPLTGPNATSNSRSAGVRRLMKEASELERDDSTEYKAAPLDDNIFTWHFTIKGPGDDYTDGFYHGKMVLPPDYPFNPPEVYMLTPSGRFEINKPICLSISSFHPESWQPSWGIRTAVVALRAFFLSEPQGAVGSVSASAEERQRLAKRSLTFECPSCKYNAATSKWVERSRRVQDGVAPSSSLSTEGSQETQQIEQKDNQNEQSESVPQENVEAPVNGEPISAGSSKSGSLPGGTPVPHSGLFIGSASGTANAAAVADEGSDHHPKLGSMSGAAVLLAGGLSPATSNSATATPADESTLDRGVQASKDIKIQDTDVSGKVPNTDKGKGPSQTPDEESNFSSEKDKEIRINHEESNALVAQSNSASHTKETTADDTKGKGKGKGKGKKSVSLTPQASSSRERRRNKPEKKHALKETVIYTNPRGRLVARAIATNRRAVEVPVYYFPSQPTLMDRCILFGAIAAMGFLAHLLS